MKVMGYKIVDLSWNLLIPKFLSFKISKKYKSKSSYFIISYYIIFYLIYLSLFSYFFYYNFKYYTYIFFCYWLNY